MPKKIVRVFVVATLIAAFFGYKLFLQDNQKICGVLDKVSENAIYLNMSSGEYLPIPFYRGIEVKLAVDTGKTYCFESSTVYGTPGIYVFMSIYMVLYAFAAIFSGLMWLASTFYE